MDHLVGCSCKETKEHPAKKSESSSSISRSEECELQFEFNSELSPILYSHLPVVDLAVSYELCPKQMSACIVKIGPVCFHQSHQDFSGG